jgi:hypothetical protein
VGGLLAFMFDSAVSGSELKTKKFGAGRGGKIEQPQRTPTRTIAILRTGTVTAQTEYRCFGP